MQHAGRGSRSHRRIAALAAAALTASGLALAGAGTAGGQETVTFTVATTQDADTLNPLAGFLVIDFEVWNLQYSSVTNMAADDFSIEPGLAEEWEVSDDGLTVTYTLREGLQWSDGEPLTAEDVAYTINRSRDEEWANHYATTQNLDAVAVDERTVEVTTSVPDPKLPALTVYILPKHIYEPMDADAAYEHDGLDGVGSGPFTVAEYRSSEFVRMERNPNWWGPEPAMDQVIIRIFESSEAQYQALVAGEVDAIDEVPEEIFETLEEGDGAVAPVAGNQGGFIELAMNAGCMEFGDGHPALEDVRVRQAINHAINRQELVDRVLLGNGVPGTSIYPSASPEWDFEPSEEEELGYDPERSAELLDEAGWTDEDGDGVRSKDGRDLRLRLFDRPAAASADSTEFIVEWLGGVGIPTDVASHEDDQLTAIIGQGEYDLFIWGWVPYVDPDILLSYFTSAEVTTDATAPGWNDASWCNEEYDALYDEQQVELDPERRREIVDEMLRIFYVDAPYAVLYKYDDLQAVRQDRWTNFSRQPAETGPVLFNNTSPSYLTIERVGAGDDAGGEAADGAGGSDDSGTNAGVIIAIVVGALAVIGGGIFLINRRRRTADERE
jgi:peptide/nickel transport system substrate-binding protein